MSRHWRPDEFVIDAVAPRRPPRAPLSPGAKAGLLLVAAACAGVVIGLHLAFGRADVFADDMASQLPLDR